jgi:PAS domain S-box-containing protein
MISALYVDDETGLLKLTRSFLKKEKDITVDTAESASIALEKIRETDYDVIISDYEMPEMDGLDLLKALRASGNLTPFIIFTGRGREDVVIQAFNEGADFYLQKGGDPRAQFAELIHKIRRTVGHHQAEKALKESEERFRSFVENANAIVYSITAGGTLSYVSPNFTEMLGYDAREVIGHSFDSFIHPDDIASWSEFLGWVIGSAEKKGAVECRMRHMNREWRWHTLSVAQLRDASDRVPSYVGVAQDITDRRGEQEALAKAAALAKVSEERHILLDSIQTQVWYLTDDHTYGAVNEAHAAFSGKRREDLSFNSLYEIFPNDVAEVCRRGNIQVFSTGKPLHCDEWVPDASGERRLLSIQKSPRLRADGSVEYVVCSAEDITEKKRAETALQESEANFRTFFESMTDLILVSGLDGRMLFSNSAVARILGYSKEEMTLMHMLDLHPAEFHNEAEEIFAAMLRGERDSCPLPLARKDGTLVPVETRVWFGRWNGEDCIFGICKDLTAEREAQQRFERLFFNNPTPMALSSLPDRKFYEVNDSFLKTLRCSRSEVIGRSSSELGLFVDPDQQAEIARRLSENERVTDFEIQVRNKDGAILEGLFSGEVIRSQGQKYFLTVMIDITERKRMEKELNRQSRLQQLLMEISSTYINLPLETVEEKINDSLGKIGRFVEADRVYIFSYDFHRQVCCNNNEWCKEGIEPQIDLLQNVPLEDMQSWIEPHQKGESIYIPDILSLPPGALRDVLEPQGIKSLLAVPLMCKGECIGFVGFDSVKMHREYSEGEQRLLIFFAQMLVNIQQRKQAEEDLSPGRDKTAHANLISTGM